MQKQQPKPLYPEQKHIYLNKMKKSLAPYCFLAPSFLGIGIFVLIPFGDVIRRSFLEAMGGRFVGMENYKTVWNNQAFQMAVKNTGEFIGLCIPLLLFLSFFLALFLHKIKKGKDFFKTSFLIPMAIPTASLVLLWRVFFHSSGLFNSFLSEIGIQGSDWLHGKEAFFILVFSYLWKNIGYNMILWLAGLSSISSSLYEAARVDGAGEIQQFFAITLPGMMPTFFIITVLSLLNSFKVFREAYLILGDYPNESVYMIQHLFQNWFVSLDIQKMCAAAVIIAAFLFIFIILLQRVWGKEEKEDG